MSVNVVLEATQMISGGAGRPSRAGEGGRKVRVHVSGSREGGRGWRVVSLGSLGSWDGSSWDGSEGTEDRQREAVVEEEEESQAIRDPVSLRAGDMADAGRRRRGLMDVATEHACENTVAILLSTIIKTYREARGS